MKTFPETEKQVDSESAAHTLKWLGRNQAVIWKNKEKAFKTQPTRHMNEHCKHHFIRFEDFYTLSNNSDYNDYKQLKIIYFSIRWSYITSNETARNYWIFEETPSVYCSSTHSICGSIYKIIHIWNLLIGMHIYKYTIVLGIWRHTLELFHVFV